MNVSTIYLYDSDEMPVGTRADGLGPTRSTALEIAVVDDDVCLRVVEATEGFDHSSYKGVSPYLTLNVHKLIKALSSALALESPDAT